MKIRCGNLANKSYGKSKETNKPNEQTKTQTTKSPNAQNKTKHIAPSITSRNCDRNQDDFKKCDYVELRDKTENNNETV